MQRRKQRNEPDKKKGPHHYAPPLYRADFSRQEKWRSDSHHSRAVGCAVLSAFLLRVTLQILRWDSGHYSIAEKENSAERLATPG